MVPRYVSTLLVITSAITVFAFPEIAGRPVMAAGIVSLITS
jgi:hypothetical protein